MHNAVTFLKLNDSLILVYTPRDDDSWVHAKFDRGEELVIKGTFHLRQQHLLDLKVHDEEADSLENDLQFQIATLNGSYYYVDSKILSIDVPVLIHETAAITWKWFTAEERVSIFKEIAELKPQRIVIGGDAPDAIPAAEYEKMIENFPNRHELKRYVLARVGSVVREYAETQVDAERLYRAYVQKRLRRTPRDLLARFSDQEQQKYQYMLDRLRAMLASEQSYPEAVWQAEILQIILLLNPKYIKAIQNVSIRDVDQRRTRRADILLVDASGNVDLIEIKQPFDQCILTPGQYRNNHIPLRELSGAVMQIEKYIYYLNRWGKTGEDTLIEKYRGQFPEGFKIRITNPSGIIIMGRDNNLSPNQLQDFEVVRRKYTNIVDIITYDDLLRRLKFILSQYRDSTVRLY